ncbi:MAG: polysaccharide deacetylase family protein [Chloroflexi bacterium]|nr:polysaccharide deacetylase family protein [Chloroflexota bacterium]
MERDFARYANNPPRVAWPNGARLAVSVCVNYEEGREYSLLDGPRRETMDEVPSPVPAHMRVLYNESFFEYGSRVGVWRFLDFLDMLARYEVPATFFASARPLERNAAVAKAIVEGGHEVCGHGYGWQEYHATPIDEEPASIRRWVTSLLRATGQQPVGWLTRSVCSLNTRELLLKPTATRRAAWPGSCPASP